MEILRNEYITPFIIYPYINYYKETPLLKYHGEPTFV